MRVYCGRIFPDREIEDPLRVLWAIIREKYYVDVDLLTCGLWRERASMSSGIKSIKGSFLSIAEEGIIHHATKEKR
jgi:hypothetical protein